MDLLSNYKGWELTNPKVARCQANMEICVFDGRKPDIKGERRIKLLAISNNNTQYEVMIPIDAWEVIK